MTGLYEFGSGADGAFTTSTTGYVLTYVASLSTNVYVLTFPRSGESGKKTWQWTTFDTPTTISGYPAMLKLTGPDPITFRCTGAANVNCLILGNGENGNSGSYTYGGSVTLPAGGLGNAGGGNGGGGGSYTSGGTTPTDGNAGKDEAGSSAGTHGGKGGPGKFYTSWDTNSATSAHAAGGGAGGGHASAGTAGGAGYNGYSGYTNWNLTAAAAGTTYGSLTLANGPEGGAGGGQGGNVIAPTSSGGTTGYYFYYGGTGGGGGGGFGSCPSGSSRWPRRVPSR